MSSQRPSPSNNTYNKNEYIKISEEPELSNN